jgi:hypothetical protein
MMLACCGCLLPALGSAQPAGYYLSIDNIHIDNTRSLHNDTDFANLTVKVNDRLLPQQTASMGDVNNGDHYPGLQIYPIPISDSDTVTFNYLVVNAGHSGTADHVKDALDASGAALASKGLQSGNPWYVGIGGILWGLGLLFADCDGPVAGDQISMTGADLKARLGTSGFYTETRSYSGSDSPTGCGSNSQYSVTFSVFRTHWSGPWEIPGGGRTDAALAATWFQNRIWLFAKGTDDRIYFNQSADRVNWTGWSEVPGGGMTDSGLAVAHSDTRLWVFAKGLDNKIYLNYFDPSITSFSGDGWYGWDEVAGGEQTDASLGAAYDHFGGLGGDYVHVFAKRAGAPQIDYNSFQVPLPSSGGPTRGGPGPIPPLNFGSRDAKKFGVWAEIPGGGLTDAGPSAFVADKEYVLVKGMGRPSVFYNALFDYWGPAWLGGWNEIDFNYPLYRPWSTDGATSSIGVSFNSEIHVLETNVNGKIYYRHGPVEAAYYAPGMVRLIPDTYVSTSSAPAAVVQAGSLLVFYVGSDQRIYMNSWDGNPSGL